MILFESGSRLKILTNETALPGVKIAVKNLQADFYKVTGVEPDLGTEISNSNQPVLIIGTVGVDQSIDELIKKGKLNKDELSGKNEKYLIQNVTDPFDGIKEAIVIAGSDKRGTIYGIYELSKQIGVSPWYYWADVPIEKRSVLSFERGNYTDGEPAVKYRGIFLNDEAPALSG